MMYVASLKSINEKAILSNKAMKKKISETVLINDVVLGKLKFIPIVNVKVVIKKIKLPIVSKS